MDKKYIYAEGLYFNPVKPETPDSVKAWKKGSISIQKDRFMAQLADLPADEKGYVRFDLTKNEKDGKPFYSFKLNDWKPERVIQVDEAAVKMFAEHKPTTVGGTKPDYDDAAAIRAEDIPW